LATVNAVTNIRDAEMRLAKHNAKEAHKPAARQKELEALKALELEMSAYNESIKKLSP